jgi:hypothetical protein
MLWNLDSLGEGEFSEARRPVLGAEILVGAVSFLAAPPRT